MSMFHEPAKRFFSGSFGTDLFEDPASARIKFKDDLNTYMFKTMFRDYISWHEKNHHFHSNYESDQRLLSFLNLTKYLWAGAGILLAGMVVNPNYTSPRSFYLRKLNVVIFAWLGFSFGMRNYENHKAAILLRMNDYFPMEVKRALRTQDYRYLALFDYNNPGRQLFDEVTGKSLS